MRARTGVQMPEDEDAGQGGGCRERLGRFQCCGPLAAASGERAAWPAQRRLSALDAPGPSKPAPAASHSAQHQPSCPHQQATEQRRGGSGGLATGAASWGCGRRLQPGKRRLQ